MASCKVDTSNYVRCHEAIQLVCHQAAPLVDNVLQDWHSSKKQVIQPCSRPKPRPPTNPHECSDRSKPKPLSSCQNCVAWGAAVEAEYYPQSLKGGIPWGNINPACFSRSYMQVAKAFVLRLQQTQIFAKAVDFDSASLLMLMMHFGEFHKRDHASYEVIKEVFSIRNTLSHMKLKDKLHISDQLLNTYFNSIHDLVSCLERLHPRQFKKTDADDVRSNLNKILQSPVTVRMTKEALRPLTDAMTEVVFKTMENQFREHSQAVVTTVQQEFQEHSSELIKQVNQRIGKQTQTMEQAVAGGFEGTAEVVSERLSQEMKHLKDHVDERTTTFVMDQEKRHLDVTKCREHLMLEYRHSRGKIPLLPGMPEEFANMEDLYVGLELSEKHKQLPAETNKKLESQNDLCTMKDQHGNLLKRILVIGGPGSGKTTLVSKLAYDWATKGLANVKCDLLIALDFREVRDGMNLIDIIQDQLLPKVCKKELARYIESHARSIIYLFDGFDEAHCTLQTGDLIHVLSNKWLQESLVIVTTRPHKMGDFLRSYGVYTLVDVMKLSFDRICEFVVRYFHHTPYLRHISYKLEQLLEGVYSPSFDRYDKNMENIKDVLNELFAVIMDGIDKIRERAEIFLACYIIKLRCNEIRFGIVQQTPHQSDPVQLFWKIFGPHSKYRTVCIKVDLFLEQIPRITQLDLFERSNTRPQDFLSSLRRKLFGNLKPEDLVQVVEFTKTLCYSRILLQEKVGEVMLDLEYLDNPAHLPYGHLKNLKGQIEGIKRYVCQLKKLCEDMKRLQPQADDISVFLEACRNFRTDPEVFNRLGHVEISRELAKKSIGTPPLLQKKFRDICCFLESSCIIKERTDHQYGKPILASSLKSTLYSVCNNDAVRSFLHLYDHPEQCSDNLKQKASDAAAHLINLNVILQEKARDLTSFITQVTVYCDIPQELRLPTNINLETFIDLLDIPRETYQELRQKIADAVSFLKSFETSGSLEETDKKIEEIVSLLELLKKSAQYRTLSEIPALLTIMCLLWEENRCLPDTMTELFDESVRYLANHRAVKYEKQQDLDVEETHRKLESVMLQVGETALNGLFNNQLVFRADGFPSNILVESCCLGLLTKEKKRSKLNPIINVTFTHKTFQEFCAAHYLAHMVETNRNKFMVKVDLILDDNYQELGLMLQFCCRLNPKAAEIILPHVVKLCCNAYNCSPEMQLYKKVIAIRNDITTLEKEELPLLLFKEIQAPEFSKYLQPLYPGTETEFVLRDDLANTDALIYLLDCQIQFHKENLLKNIVELTISILGQHTSAKHEEAIAKLLQCVPQLRSLNINTVIFSDTGGFGDSEGAIANSFSKLKKLEDLQLSGLRDNMNGLVYSLCECQSITALKSVVIRYPEFDTNSVIRLISKQTILRSLVIYPYQRKVDSKWQQKRKIGISYFDGDFVCMENDIKEILDSIQSLTTLRELRLCGCQVPAASICHLLLGLTVLDIQCPDWKFGKPFDSTELFTNIIMAGDVFHKRISEWNASHDEQDCFTITTLPLRLLQLSNGRLSNNAVGLLAIAFRFIPKLLELNLGWDSLDEAGVKTLSTALPFLSHLQSFGLAGIQIGNATEILCEGLTETRLTSLKLISVCLTDERARILAKYLHFWPGLETLDLSENPMREEGVEVLRHETQYLINLKEFKTCATETTFDNLFLV